MGLINALLKLTMLMLDLRETLEWLTIPRMVELGQMDRAVTVRDANNQLQTTRKRRVGGSKRRSGLKSALTTVLIWNLFTKLESLLDNTLAWFVPFYDSFKTLFLVWMLFTRSFGATILMNRVIVPVVQPYEGVFVGILHLAATVERWSAAAFVALRLKRSVETSGVTEVFSAEEAKSGPTIQHAPKTSVGEDDVASNSAPTTAPRRPSKKASSASIRQSSKEKRSVTATLDTKPRKVLHEIPIPLSSSASQSESHILQTTALAESVPLPESPAMPKSFAYIPGQTSLAVRTSVVSPTPQFPGGFGSSSLHARVPFTATMPSLTLSQSPNQHNLIAPPSRPLPSLEDDQIVPPPGMRAKTPRSTVRKPNTNGVSKSSMKVTSTKIPQSSATTSEKNRKRTQTDASESTNTAPSSTARKRLKVDTASKSSTDAGNSTPKKKSAMRREVSEAAQSAKVRSVVKDEEKPASPPKTRLTRSRTRQNLAD